MKSFAGFLLLLVYLWISEELLVVAGEKILIFEEGFIVTVRGRSGDLANLKWPRCLMLPPTCALKTWAEDSSISW